MKHRHLIGALIAIAPVAAFAQTGMQPGTTPPAGTATPDGMTATPVAPLPGTTPPAAPATETGNDAAATTDALEPGAAETDNPAANGTATVSDPTAPKPKA